MSIDRRSGLHAVIGMALIVATVAPAAATQTKECAPRDLMLTELEQAFEEKPVSVGVTSTGELLEVLAGPAGTWTLLVTLPGGPTCMVTHGDGWETRGQQKDDPLA